MNKYDRSAGFFQKASGLMPGGVSSPVRAFKSVGGTPVYFESAGGSRFKDADGNTYTDYCMSWGPLILGHSHPKVIEAVCDTAKKGLSFGACCRLEIDVAEIILSVLESADRIRFVSSGTEAVMTALRLARGATGRDKIIKFEGGYHGHADAMLVKAGSGLVTLGQSSSRGVPESVAKDTIVCPFDDVAVLDDVFKKYGDDIAALIVEPVPANNGLLLQRPEWLGHLRTLTEKYGALLISDEVITGFRMRAGSYIESLGIRPDLITLGKVIGGGMPLGAVAGPERLMKKLAPIGDVYQAGTLSGNPVSLAAGKSTLQILSEGSAYEILEKLGNTLDAKMGEIAQSCGMTYIRKGSIFWLYLASGEPPRSTKAINPKSAGRYGAMHKSLLDSGIYLAPSAYEVGFLSTAHTEGDIAELADKVASALK